MPWPVALRQWRGTHRALAAVRRAFLALTGERVVELRNSNLGSLAAPRQRSPK
jgi:hypothetical protein